MKAALPTRLSTGIMNRPLHRLISFYIDEPMVGWILVIAVAIITLYAADTVVYLITWFVSFLNAAFSVLGFRIEAFDYLDILYPYFRSTVQALAVGTVLVAVFHIVTSIREQA
jgi:hypothetical protein